MSKAPDAYLHGDGGPVVIVPARVAAILKRKIPLDRLRVDARDMRDAETYHVLNALHRAALSYAPEGASEASKGTPQTIAYLSVKQAATITGLSERGVRDACANKRLDAQQIDGRWRINSASAKQYRK